MVLEVECILGVDPRASFCIAARNILLSYHSRGRRTQDQTYIWRQVCNRLIDPLLDLPRAGRGLW